MAASVFKEVTEDIYGNLRERQRSIQHDGDALTSNKMSCDVFKVTKSN